MKVLLVDDSPFSLEATQRFLESVSSDISVSTADSMTEAVRDFKWNRPDLVLLDLVFGMDYLMGIDILKEIKRIDSSVPVYIFSANGQEEMKEKCREAGSDGYFVKMTDDDRLRKFLRAEFSKQGG